MEMLPQKCPLIEFICKEVLKNIESPIEIVSHFTLINN